MIRISAIAEHLKQARVNRVQGVIDYAALRAAPSQLGWPPARCRGWQR